jgi:hypothetical protein
MRPCKELIRKLLMPRYAQALGRVLPRRRRELENWETGK